MSSKNKESAKNTASTHLHMRAKPSQKETIREAANLRGQGISEFVIEQALRAAKRVIQNEGEA